MILEPIPQRGLRFYLAKLLACRCPEEPVMHPAKREFTPPPKSGPQQLGPNQLKWLDERFQFFGIHRKQAEAPTGVAVVHPKGLGE